MGEQNRRVNVSFYIIYNVYIYLQRYVCHSYYFYMIDFPIKWRLFKIVLEIENVYNIFRIWLC